MSILERLKPKFWNNQHVVAGSSDHSLNFRRIWKLSVLLTAAVTLAPLIFMTLVDYKVTQNAIESEALLRTSRIVSNARRTISFFLSERTAGLGFIVRDNSFKELRNPTRLAEILENLKEAFGGFTDLGVIDSSGRQVTYVGPYRLEGMDYSDQESFRGILKHDSNVSDVFLGFRNVPHLVISVKHDLPDGSFYVLRATLDTVQFDNLLAQLNVGGEGDAFIINREGILQTPSQHQGKILEKIQMSVPRYFSETKVFEGKAFNGQPLVVGYAYIDQTPFILMIVKQKAEVMNYLYQSRIKLVGFLAASITIILLVVLGVSTYLVNMIYIADEKWAMTMHKMEHSNKMASIGRLAAGVAHEVNNPLAVINEKAGLIKDMLAFQEQSNQNQKLMGLVDSVLASVERCGRITRRLLKFARPWGVSMEPIKVGQVMHEVLGFLGKEAEHRSISIHVDVAEEIPQFESDRGKLQQIFLNLLTNAFAAMSDHGRLEITARCENENYIAITFVDTGCGIPEADLKRIFEPFFSTKMEKDGTGLGMSITRRLVAELGGKIRIESEVGKGTKVIITLPVRMERKEV